LRRHLCVALALLAGACSQPLKATPTPVPKSTDAACATENAPQAIYVVDGKVTTCTAAMSLQSGDIASVEVLKGAAAAALHGPAATAGVVVIQTKRRR
jgi:TonB-dependent SusC/RagA subfamily outer membrane receptor